SEADICSAKQDVRFGQKADIREDVSFELVGPSLPWEAKNFDCGTSIAGPCSSRAGCSSAIVIRSLSCNLRSSIEPDRHAWFEAVRMPLQIEAQAQRIAIVIANGTLGLPSRERAERAQLGDQSWRLLHRARPPHIDACADREAVQQIFARIERQKLFAHFSDNEHRLAGVDVLADL